MEKKIMKLQCDNCKHKWEIPLIDEEGNDYNADDLYRCPKCDSDNFGEI